MEIVIKILDAFEKLFIHVYGEKSKFSSKISALVLLSVAILTLVNAIWKLYHFLVLRRNQKILNKNLTPFGYTNSDVFKATEYYVVPKFQNVSPTEDDEPGASYIASAKSKIMPLFINDVFKRDKLDEKFFLVLADTGMGKTSFMINLFIRYKNKKGLFFSPFNYEIKLLPLGNPDTFEKIRAISDKEKTILLLDAFDEDILALDRHEERMDEIIAIVKDFRFIVITCRTQFFPSDKEEPHRTKYFTFGESNKEYKFQKIYLSAFDNQDIKKYLRKRFGFSLLPKYKKAKLIADKSPSLVVRPLLLSYIEDIIESNKTITNTVDIYEALIDKWIDREANKPGIIQKYGSKEKYKDVLYAFSEKLAWNLYENRKERGGYFIDKDEKLPDSVELQMEDIEKIYLLTESEKRSKSLLNRNSVGRYKFSHKSILEFFLAKILANGNCASYFGFDFEGMSFIKRFVIDIGNELLINKLNNSSLYKTLSFENKANVIIVGRSIQSAGNKTELNGLSISKIKTLIIIEKEGLFYDLNPAFFTKMSNIGHVRFVVANCKHELGLIHACIYFMINSFLNSKDIDGLMRLNMVSFHGIDSKIDKDTLYVISKVYDSFRLNSAHAINYIRIEDSKTKHALDSLNLIINEIGDNIFYFTSVTLDKKYKDHGLTITSKKFFKSEKNKLDIYRLMILFLLDLEEKYCDVNWQKVTLNANNILTYLLQAKGILKNVELQVGTSDGPYTKNDTLLSHLLE